MVGRKNECQVHGLVVRDVTTLLAASTGIDVQRPTLGLLMKRLLLEFLGPQCAARGIRFAGQPSAIDAGNVHLLGCWRLCRQGVRVFRLSGFRLLASSPKSQGDDDGSRLHAGRYGCMLVALPLI